MIVNKPSQTKWTKASQTYSLPFTIDRKSEHSFARSLLRVSQGCSQASSHPEFSSWVLFEALASGLLAKFSFWSTSRNMFPHVLLAIIWGSCLAPRGCWYSLPCGSCRPFTAWMFAFFHANRSPLLGLLPCDQQRKLCAFKLTRSGPSHDLPFTI